MQKISMHSSGMRTARLLTVSCSIGGGGGGRVSAQGVGCLPGGGVYPGEVYPNMQWGRYPPP